MLDALTSLDSARLLLVPPHCADPEVFTSPDVLDAICAVEGESKEVSRNDLATVAQMFVAARLMTAKAVRLALASDQSEAAMYRLTGAAFEKWVEGTKEHARRLAQSDPHCEITLLVIGLVGVGERAAEDQQLGSEIRVGIGYDGDGALYDLRGIARLPESVGKICGMALNALQRFAFSAHVDTELIENTGYGEMLGEYQELRDHAAAQDVASARKYMAEHPDDFYYMPKDSMEELQDTLKFVKAMSDGLPSWARASVDSDSPQAAARCLRRALRSNASAFSERPEILRYVQRVAAFLASSELHAVVQHRLPLVEYDSDESAPMEWGTFFDMGCGYETQCIDEFVNGMQQQGSCFGEEYDLQACCLQDVERHVAVRLAAQLFYFDLQLLAERI